MIKKILLIVAIFISLTSCDFVSDVAQEKQKAAKNEQARRQAEEQRRQAEEARRQAEEARRQAEQSIQFWRTMAWIGGIGAIFLFIVGAGMGSSVSQESQEKENNRIE